MIIKALSLQNFRNYPQKSFDFSNGCNLIVGPNAIGKTNILEAVYFLSTGKSFRVKGVEREAILYQKEIARIKGEVENKDQKTKLEIILTVGEIMGEKTAKKKYLVNQVGRRAVDFLGNLLSVYFGPEDLELITDSPGLRRKYLDSVLVQTDHEYRRASLSYEKGLRQRNKILEGIREAKDLGYNEENLRKRLYFWDQLLIKNGNIITDKREEFLQFINQCQPVSNMQFSVEYERSTISAERIAHYAKEEVGAGMTLVGPHRDDFKINEKQRNLSVYGSRGEQRLAILWLKLAELDFLEKETKVLPILLLDDIFSELDMEHRQLVFELVTSHQTIITTTDINIVDKNWLKQVNLINLSLS